MTFLPSNEVSRVPVERQPPATQIDGTSLRSKPTKAIVGCAYVNRGHVANAPPKAKKRQSLYACGQAEGGRPRFLSKFFVSITQFAEYGFLAAPFHCSRGFFGCIICFFGGFGG
jgi:hypothetical protein